MPKIVQSLWVGTDLSPVEALCIRSFLKHGHAFHLYTYRPLGNMPAGTTILDANAILPESSIYRSHDGRMSSFSNFFRWKLLNMQGGLWVDMDVVCLKPFDFPDDIIFGHETEDSINTAVLGFPAGHLMTTAMVKACEDVNLFQPIDSLRTVLKKSLRRAFLGKEKSRVYTRFSEPGGPSYFTKFLKHYDLADLAKPVHWFYPVPWWNWADVFRPGAIAETVIAESYALHLWNNALHRDPHMDKNNLNLEGSLFNLLCDRYA